MARLSEVERRHLRREPNVLIARDLGVSEATIRNDLKRIQELWKERVSGSVAEMRAAVVAEIEATQRLALEAYEFDRRMEAAVLTGVPFVGDDGQEREIHHGPRGAQFRGAKAQSLNVVRQGAMDKAKILGIVVDKISPTDAEGRTLTLADIALRFREQQRATDDDGDRNS